MARICDICAAAANDQVAFQRTDERFDVCLSCGEKIKELITRKEKVEDKTEPKKRGRKPRGKKS